MVVLVVVVVVVVVVAAAAGVVVVVVVVVAVVVVCCSINSSSRSGSKSSISSSGPNRRSRSWSEVGAGVGSGPADFNGVLHRQVCTATFTGATTAGHTTINTTNSSTATLVNFCQNVDSSSGSTRRHDTETPSRIIVARKLRLGSNGGPRTADQGHHAERRQNTEHRLHCSRQQDDPNMNGNARPFKSPTPCES